MLEPSTLIRKFVLGHTEEHPGWSASRIAAEIDQSHPGLVDDLFRSRRTYLLRGWVSEIVGEARRAHRDGIKAGEVLAALHPDGQRRIFTLAEMTGYQVAELGERYLTSGARLTQLGNAYVEIGALAGGRKIKNITDDEAATLSDEAARIVRGDDI